MKSVKARFLEYVKINTQSKTDAEEFPSTRGQLEFARLLVDEMKAIGLEEVTLDEHGYVMAALPATFERDLPVIGLIAHMDTSEDMRGEGVNPQIIPAYDGGDVVLNQESGLVMSARMFPELKKYKGQELITTDGSTLLGADDKAGVAAILTAMEYLLAHPEIRHGKVRVAFTPDEETGRGVDHFNVAKFGADFAYTVDGGEIGELEYETFNASQGYVTVIGRNVHPGSAKGKMLNSMLVAMEFNALLPANERPEHTEGREGFFHLNKMQASIEETKMVYLIRDHDRGIFDQRKAILDAAGELLNKRYGEGTVEVVMKDVYYNMREMIEPVFHIVELAKQAMRKAGVEPILIPVRGGTDGARLSFMGLPCPNLFTGGLNFHGRYECLPTRSLEKAVEVVLNIITLAAQGE